MSTAEGMAPVTGASRGLGRASARAVPGPGVLARPARPPAAPGPPPARAWSPLRPDPAAPSQVTAAASARADVTLLASNPGPDPYGRPPPAPGWDNGANTPARPHTRAEQDDAGWRSPGWRDGLDWVRSPIGPPGERNW